MPIILKRMHRASCRDCRVLRLIRKWLSLQELKERLGKFGLELQPEKTRLIEFGRFAAERIRRRRVKNVGYFFQE